MNNKILLIIAIITLAAGWFFGNNTHIDSPVKVESPKFEYEATEIKAVQTNDEGFTEYEINAKSLSHNNETNKDQLVDVTMDWQPVESKKYQLTAGLTELNQETGDMVMKNGFKLVSMQINGQQKANKEETALTDPIIITGDNLIGNTKIKQIKTNNPVEFKQANNQFTANGMVANLETGEYEFEGINITFTPSERKDKPLF